MPRLLVGLFNQIHDKEPQPQPLNMLLMREKLNRFIEALARCEGAMELTEQDWGDLVECVVVKPDTLTFEFKDNSKIEVAIQP